MTQALSGPSLQSHALIFLALQSSVAIPACQRLFCTLKAYLKVDGKFGLLMHWQPLIWQSSQIPYDCYHEPKACESSVCFGVFQ
jgi:hypothetical protein